MNRTAWEHRSWDRPTPITRAPRRASSQAVTSPMPAVAPVTRQTFPAIEDFESDCDIMGFLG